MNSPLKIVTPKEECAIHARKILEEALTKNFETALVVGIAPNGCVYADFSKAMDTAKLLGSLELLKHEILNSWADAAA